MPHLGIAHHLTAPEPILRSSSPGRADNIRTCARRACRSTLARPMRGGVRLKSLALLLRRSRWHRRVRPRTRKQGTILAPVLAVRTWHPRHRMSCRTILGLRIRVMVRPKGLARSAKIVWKVSRRPRAAVMAGWAGRVEEARRLHYLLSQCSRLPQRWEKRLRV